MNIDENYFANGKPDGIPVSRLVNHIRVFQIPAIEEHPAILRNSRYLKEQGQDGPDPSIYEMGFDGYVIASCLEDVFHSFSMYTYESIIRGDRQACMSTSDVVQVVSGFLKRGFYFCDSFGWKKVDFDLEKVGTAWGRKLHL